MKRVFYWLLLFVSLPVLGSTSNSYTNIIKNSDCDSFFLDSPLPFHITDTTSVTVSASRVLALPKPDIIPPQVLAAAENAGHLASTVSLAACSPSSVTQASRIGTISSVLTCSDSSEFESQPLDWSQSPTRISLGHGALQYVDGAILGNWALWGVFALVHTLAAHKWGAAKLNYPGFLILPALFLSAPTAQAAVTLLRLGTPLEKAVGALSLVAQLGIVGKLAYFLRPAYFEAKIEQEASDSLLSNLAKRLHFEENPTKSKWRSGDNPDYVHNYGMFFKDYRQEGYAFMVPELIMTLSSGILDSFQIEPQSSCKNLLYASTAVYGIYATSLLALRPHIEGFDRIYFGSVATAQFLALAFGSIQKAAPSLQNNTAFQTVAQAIPVALQYVTLVRSVYDATQSAYTGYQYLSGKTIERSLSIKQPAIPWLEPNDREMLPVVLDAVFLKEEILDTRNRRPVFTVEIQRINHLYLMPELKTFKECQSDW